MRYLNRGDMKRTMWWTPTRGLLMAAASDFAALEPTLRQPPIPKYHS